jgi:hypothetical protein
MEHWKNVGFFYFGLAFIGRSKEFYNPLKPIFYIPMHKERGKGHKLHDNDLILPLQLFYS